MTLKSFLLCVPVALAVALASATWVTVDVRPSGPGGFHIWAPAPLALASLGTAFVPGDHRGVHLAGLEKAREPLRRLLAELDSVPDAELVRVEAPREQVLIRKAGGHIEVTVENAGETVRLRIPLAALQEVIESSREDRIDLGAVVRALRRHPGGEMLHITNADAEVRVAVR